MRRSVWITLTAMVVCGGGGAGCVERTLDVRSTPSGALVTMNDQEIGRTPLTKDFTWYGVFEVQVRKEGYETLKTGTPVIAPWWQWLPFDFVAEILPVRLRDRHEIAYNLKPLPAEQADPEAIVGRGQALRERLEGSRLPQPATRPATTRPAKPAR